MSKKVIFSVIGIVFLLGLIGAGVYVGFVKQNVFGETIYKADWGHICCEEGAYEPPFKRYADDVPSYSCDAYTDECRIKIDVIDPPAWNLYRIVVKYDVCNLDDSNCVRYDYIGMDGDTKTISIDYEKKINFINPGVLWDHRSYYKYEADYRRFYIQGVEEGKTFVQKSCILNSELRKKVLSDGLNELPKTGDDRCQNYIIGYVPVATKTYSYLNRRVVCQARDIYEIDTITLLDGSTEKMQGEWIKFVDCCPHESNCGEDFEWKEVVVKECDYNYQCANGGEPISITGTSTIQWKCVDNKCVQQDPVTRECTNNAICVDKLNNPSAVCKDFKCGVDEAWLGHCGDGICETILGETSTSCPEDCGEWIPPPKECGCWIESPLSDECLLPDLWCHFILWIENVIKTVAIVFGILAGILAGLFSYRLTKDKEQLKKKWWIFLIGILIIGIAVWYLTLLYWLWILFGLIVLGLIKWLVPGV